MDCGHDLRIVEGRDSFIDRSDRFEKGATSASRDADTGPSEARVSKEPRLQELKADGLAKLLTKRKATFDKEAVDVAFQDYLKIRSIRRADGFDMITYFLESDRAHARLGEYNMTVPDNVLACKLLYPSKINAKERLTVVSTTKKLEYSMMKSSIKQILNVTASALSCWTGPPKKSALVASDGSTKR